MSDENSLNENHELSAAVLIRSAEIIDADGLTTLVNLPGFRAGTMRLPFQRVEETRQWLAKPGPGLPNLVALIDGMIVGNASLKRFSSRRQHVATLGMGVHDQYTGRGIGSLLLSSLLDTADNWLNIRRLELTVYTDNTAALALYRKFDFVEEGCLRDFAFRAGRFVDAYAMARIRSCE